MADASRISLRVGTALPPARRVGAPARQAVEWYHRNGSDTIFDIEVEQQKLEKQALTMQNEFEEKYQVYESQMLMLSNTKKAEIEKELDDLRTNFLLFQQENLNPDTGKLAQMWMEKIGPIADDIQRVIDRFGVEEGYDVIFDTPQGFILYANEEYDITDHILEELKKK